MHISVLNGALWDLEQVYSGICELGQLSRHYRPRRDAQTATKQWVWTIPYKHVLIHWGRVTHICVSDRTIIGSDNGLSPCRRQAIIGTNAGILLIRPLGTNFSEILIEILIFSFKKMSLKVSSAKRRPFCLGFNVLNVLWATLYVHWKHLGMHLAVINVLHVY